MTASLIFLTLIIESIFLSTIFIFDTNPISRFETGILINSFSAIQLLLIGLLSLLIFKKARHLIWAVIATGFLVLSLSEITQLHEALDKSIHLFFSLEQTSISRHLDNFIIATLGIAGTVYFFNYLSKANQTNWFLFPVLISGLFISLMLVTDILISSHKIIWLNVIEEEFKLLSEGILISSFFMFNKISSSKV